jgi:hypothetical protein
VTHSLLFLYTFVIIIIIIIIKVQFTLEEALKPQRGIRSLAVLFFNLGARLGVGCQHQPLAA